METLGICKARFEVVWLQVRHLVQNLRGVEAGGDQ